MRLKLVCFIFLALSFLTACQPTQKPKEEATSVEVEISEETETIPAAEKPKSDIEFIKDKYAIIVNANPHRIDSFIVECGGGTTRLERRYNEKEEISYLQYEICGGHGCSTSHHYFWEGKLIFKLYQDTYWVGNSDYMKEHRTYFKDQEMIRCLEKEVSTTNGQPSIEDLMKKTPNSEVDCTTEKLTEDLVKLMTLKQGDAESYLCE